MPDPQAPTADLYRTIVEASPEAAYVVVDGRIAYVNAAAVRLFGAPSAAALVGTDILAHVHSDDHARALERRRQVLEAGALAPLVEMRFVRLDGEIVDVEVHATPIEFEGRRGTCATARDITERKRLEEHLRQSQNLEAVGRLAGGVAHDFNNTLAVILGHVEFALAELPPTSPLRGELEAVDRAARRSATLTQQLLAYARRHPSTPRPLDLNEAIEGTVRLLRPLIGEQVTLRWMPADSLWPVELDPAQLDQVLTNLCANARDAIEGTGTITIATSARTLDATAAAAIPEGESGDYVVLSVSDDGRGIAEDLLPRIFEPFFTTKGVGEGTGLGLSTVYGIVRQHHGFVAVRSAPKVGTQFDLYFPRRVVTAESPAVAVSAPPPASPPGHEVVLVVEDEPQILRLATRALRAQGYEVLSAEGPQEAMRLAADAAVPIDLLLTDVMMPVMTGPDLAERMREARPALRVLFMSGFSADLVARHGPFAESNDFMSKPFTLTDLTQRVRAALDRGRPSAPSAPPAASRSSAA